MRVCATQLALALVAFSVQISTAQIQSATDSGSVCPLSSSGRSNAAGFFQRYCREDRAIANGEQFFELHPMRCEENFDCNRKRGKGTYAFLKSIPCKLNNINLSKTGVHGHGKINFYGTDIFTGETVEDQAANNSGAKGPGKLSKFFDSENFVININPNLLYKLISYDLESGTIEAINLETEQKNTFFLPEELKQSAEKMVNGPLNEGKTVFLQMEGIEDDPIITGFASDIKEFSDPVSEMFPYQVSKLSEKYRDYGYLKEMNRINKLQQLKKEIAEHDRKIDQCKFQKIIQFQREDEQNFSYFEEELREHEEERERKLKLIDEYKKQS